MGSVPTPRRGNTVRPPAGAELSWKQNEKIKIKRNFIGRGLGHSGKYWEGIIVPLHWQSGQLKYTSRGLYRRRCRLLHRRRCRWLSDRLFYDGSSIPATLVKLFRLMPQLPLLHRHPRVDEGAGVEDILLVFCTGSLFYTGTPGVDDQRRCRATIIRSRKYESNVCNWNNCQSDMPMIHSKVCSTRDVSVVTIKVSGSTKIITSKDRLIPILSWEI